MAEDKPDKPSFLGRLFGVDPEEERRKQEKLQKAKKEIEALGTELQKIADAKLEQVKATGEAHLAASQAEVDRDHERWTHKPQELDRVNDMDALKKAARSGENIADVRNRTIINQWNDGYGNIIYLNLIVKMDQVQSLSARITEQQKSFGSLGVEEQAKVKSEFESSKGTAVNVQSYKDFLQSEALGRRFQELKQSRPGPK